MKLNGGQTGELKKAIGLQFGGGENSADEFADFVFISINVDIYDTWTTSKKAFQLQVSDVLDRLRDFEKFLEALREKASNNGDGESADTIEEIRKQLAEAKDSTGGNDVEPPPAPISRKILVASGIIEKSAAGKIKKRLQDMLEDFEVVDAWDVRDLPDAIEKSWVVIAVLAVMPPQKEVKEPPLNTVLVALSRLDRARLVFLPLTNGAQHWTEEKVRDIQRKDHIDTEQFFRDDGNPLFFGSDEFKGVEIDMRIGRIAERLRAAFEATENGAAEASAPQREPVSISPGSIIVLGDPHGSSPQEVAKATGELRHALKQKGIASLHWPDGWRKGGPRPAYILARDPVFVRVVAEEETDTKQITEELEDALRSVFDARDSTLDVLSDCRRVLWRRQGAPWALLDKNADPRDSSDDLDNIETRIAAPSDFANWLARFIAPDAVIFHESLGEKRPPGLIRLLRDAVERNLSLPNRKPMIRLRPFKELPNFGNDRLTIIAIDDLPVVAGIDFHKKATERFDQFRYKIDHILDQRSTDTQDPAVLRVAMLVQDVDPFPETVSSQNSARGWQRFRIAQDGVERFRTLESDVEALNQATSALINQARPPRVA